MRRLLQLAALFAAALSAASVARAQTVVDRVVARIEDDILCLSELRELGQFQQLAGGESESDDKLLDRLVDQWIVKTEADGAHFPLPDDADVDRQIEHLRQQLASAEAFEKRLRETGLTMPQLRRIVAQQLYLTRYLDYKFRPAVRIEPAEVEAYYRKTLVPQLAARGEAAPTLDAVDERIREVLVERNINELADRWLAESRARLHIERNLK
jgi:peptidyl-prolyl cis-trans isomerase SurA